MRTLLLISFLIFLFSLFNCLVGFNTDGNAVQEGMEEHIFIRFVQGNGSNDGNDSNGDSSGGDSKKFYEEWWFWITICVILAICLFCFLLCVLKSCCCQSTNSLKYRPIDPTKYKTSTPETDKKRAEMQAKWGIGSGSSY